GESQRAMARSLAGTWITTVRWRASPSRAVGVPPRTMKRAPYLTNAGAFASTYFWYLSGSLTLMRPIQYAFGIYVSLVCQSADPHASAISSRIRSAIARGSAAARMGRATTRWSAPARIAAAGVATRFWSLAAIPAGRTPGVTMMPVGPRMARTRAASDDAQTMPP